MIKTLKAQTIAIIMPKFKSSKCVPHEAQEFNILHLKWINKINIIIIMIPMHYTAVCKSFESLHKNERNY